MITFEQWVSVILVLLLGSIWGATILPIIAYTVSKAIATGKLQGQHGMKSRFLRKRGLHA